MKKIRRCWCTGSAHFNADSVYYRRLGEKITGYAGTQQYMEAMGVPGFMLPLVILLEFGGGLAILFGFLTRTTALFTAGFTLLTAFFISQQLC